MELNTLREQVEAEREANRENRRIIAALAARIPNLEALSGARGAIMMSFEPDRGTSGHSEQQESLQRRSWWREFFGLAYSNPLGSAFAACQRATWCEHSR